MEMAFAAVNCRELRVLLGDELLLWSLGVDRKLHGSLSLRFLQRENITEMHPELQYWM